MKNIAVLVYDFTVEYNIVVTDGITDFFKDKDDVHVIISTTSTPHNERFQYEYQYWTAAAQSFSTAVVFMSMVSSCSMFLLRQVRVVLSSSVTLMA